MTATYRGDRLVVSVENGGSWAPCSYLFRIVNEDVHRACMAQVAEFSGDPEPDDDRSDNVIMSEDDVSVFVPARHLRSLADGWGVEFYLDGWTACAYYGLCIRVSRMQEGVEMTDRQTITDTGWEKEECGCSYCGRPEPVNGCGDGNIWCDYHSGVCTVDHFIIEKMK